MAKKKKKKRQKSASEAPPQPSAQKSATNRMGVAVAVVLLAGLAIAVAIVGKRPRAAEAPPPQLTPMEEWEAAERKNVPLSPRNFSKGPEDAPVTIVEYSDFECPFCREASDTLKFVQELYPDKVRHVYKDFPLDTACHEALPRQVHVFGCRTAAMARCAGAQGRFWEMHDAIFSFPELNELVLAPLPESLGLDTGAFEECMTSEKTMAEVREDIAEGKRLGVNQTPTIFVNGKEVSAYYVLQQVVEHVLSSVP